MRITYILRIVDTEPDFIFSQQQKNRGIDPSPPGRSCDSDSRWTFTQYPDTHIETTSLHFLPTLDNLTQDV